MSPLYFTPYLGEPTLKIPEGRLRGTVYLSGSRLGSEPASRLLMLGSVNLQLGLELRDELDKNLQKYGKSYSKSRDYFDKAIQSLKIPSSHEIVNVFSGLQKERISELRLKPLHKKKDLRETQELIVGCYHANSMVEFVYSNRNPNPVPWRKWISTSRQVRILSVDEKGFTAAHARGVRRYLWEKVEGAGVFSGQAGQVAPELSIFIRIPGQSEKPRSRVNFAVTELHEIHSNYKLATPSQVFAQPSVRWV